MKPADLPAHDLPSVEAVEVLTGGAARLTIEGGRTVFLSPDMTPWASILSHETADALLLLTNWKDMQAPAYLVPARLSADMRQVFAHQTPSTKAHLSSAWKGNPADVPTVVNVETLPEGAARLHLADGQSVEVEDAADSYFSPEEYAPALLSIMEGQSEGPYTVPDALRFTVMGALGYAPPVGASVTSAHMEDEDAGRAVLSCQLEDGTSYLYRLSVPAAFDLSGRRSEALAGQPYTLTIHPGMGRAAVFSVSAEVWPAVLPVLTAGDKEGGKA